MWSGPVVEGIRNYHQYSLLKGEGTILSEQEWEQIGIIIEKGGDNVMEHAEMGGPQWQISENTSF